MVKIFEISGNYSNEFVYLKKNLIIIDVVICLNLYFQIVLSCEDLIQKLREGLIFSRRCLNFWDDCFMREQLLQEIMLFDILGIYFVKV